VKQWEQVRSYLLAATLLGSLGVLGKLVLFPKNQMPDMPTYTFPTTVPLQKWRFVQSYPMTLQKETAPALVTSVDAQTVAGQQYRYIQNGAPLTIEMRYFVDTYIHVPSILEDSTLASRKPDYKVLNSATGEYARFEEFGKVHQSACVTQYGGTSVSDRQLRQRQNTLPVLSKRFFPWFLGQASLRDLRCVWVNMAIETRALNANSQLLDQTWSEWVQWWQNHYPDL
jgi:cyanosortase A-associated protein